MLISWSSILTCIFARRWSDLAIWPPKGRHECSGFLSHSRHKTQLHHAWLDYVHVLSIAPHLADNSYTVLAPTSSTDKHMLADIRQICCQVCRSNTLMCNCEEIVFIALHIFMMSLLKCIKNGWCVFCWEKAAKIVEAIQIAISPERREPTNKPMIPCFLLQNEWY